MSFVPGVKKPISKQTVSRYIKQVITAAYDAQASNNLSTSQSDPLPTIKAHHVRHMANSLRALHSTSLDAVLAAGRWSSINTFIQFYLKEFAQDELTKLYALAPFCASEMCIDTPLLSVAARSDITQDATAMAPSNTPEAENTERAIITAAEETAARTLSFNEF